MPRDGFLSYTRAEERQRAALLPRVKGLRAWKRSTCSYISYPAGRSDAWIALPRQDKLSHQFLKICSTPHTLANALSVLSFTVNTTSACSPHTLDNSRRRITCSLRLGASDSSVCVKLQSEDLRLNVTPRISLHRTHASPCSAPNYPGLIFR